jgi:hypothetical protein
MCLSPLFSLVFFALFMCCQPLVFAGWQINGVQKVQEGIQLITSCVAIDFQTNNVRTDWGSALSTIVMPDHETEIQLYHGSRTYRWLYGNSANETNGQTPTLVYAGEANYDRSPAKLYCWTNGSEHEHIWVVPANKFFPLGLQQASNAGTIDGGHLSIGSFFGATSIVSRTEYSNMNPVPMPGGTDASASEGFTNVQFVMTEDLVSIIQTNFDASEFEIPDGYKDATTQPSQNYQVNPTAFGRASVGIGNSQGLRENIEKGAPVLPSIPYNDK